MIVDAGESRMLDRLAAEDPAVPWGRLLFSAKESVYKAWFPLTRRWLDFLEARLEFHPADRAFTATVLVDGARVDGGRPLTHLDGRYLITPDHIVTAVVVAHRGAGGR
jgi:4'-phosphopantetheinyl transferase EntD